MLRKDIVHLQHEVINVLLKYGVYISYNKDWHWIARLKYIITNYEPKLNIEGAILGKKFGVLIGAVPGGELLLSNEKYKIFHVYDIESFKIDFDIYIRTLLQD